MNWKDKMNYLLKACDMNRGEMAKKIGVSSSHMSALCNGVTENPTYSFIEALINKLNVNPVWLFKGEGGFFYNPVDWTSNTNDMERYLQNESNKKNYGTSINNVVYVDFIDFNFSGEDNDNSPFPKKIPVLQSMIHPYRAEKIKATPVTGDSMTKAGLFEGDIVFFVERQMIGDGIYVFTVSGITMIRRLEFDIINNRISIISESDKSPDKIIIDNNPEKISIKGKVKTWIHKNPY
jgi:phage repressor protein C with HTH and peptisase S24 domain